MAKQMGSEMAEGEVQKLMGTLDVDGSGTLDYDEFIAAAMHSSKLESDEKLYRTFCHIDKDGSNFITKDELEVALKDQGMDPSSAVKLIQDADQDSDGRIDWPEFQMMMRTGDGDIVGRGQLKSGAYRKRS